MIDREGRKFAAELVGTDEFADMAVLEVDGPVPAQAEFGNSHVLKPGETVTVNVGVVSATGRTLETGKAHQMAAITATPVGRS